MITREWMIWVVIIFQSIGGVVLIAAIGTLFIAGDRPYDLLAQLGGAVLMLWVSVSYLVLLRRYKALKEESIK